jgi:hypothetical protein
VAAALSAGDDADLHQRLSDLLADDSWDSDADGGD